MANDLILQPRRLATHLAFGLFGLVLLVAGGSVRGDALGQAVVRPAALLLVIVLLFTSDRISLRPYRVPALILAGSAAIAILQLVPMPPSWWTALSGHGLFTAATPPGEPLPWRPLNIVPDAGLNALFSLLIPAGTLVGIACLDGRAVQQLLPILIAAVLACALLALAQASGVLWDNPFINDRLGSVGGVFANRNHAALFLAIGLAVVPTFAIQRGWTSPWALTGLVLVVLLALVILATGSRAGIALGLIGLTLGLTIAWRDGGRRAARSWWVIPVVGIAMAIVVLGFVAISFDADRAASLNRLIVIDPEQDLRFRAAPITYRLVQWFFPTGSGLGSFDAAFRIAEPFDLLKPTYFNHAHDDFVEVAIETGLFGIVLLLAALAWVGWRSILAWRGQGLAGGRFGRIGSAIILLILLASTVDYPARSPIIMATLMIAGCWLCAAGSGGPVRNDPRAR